MNNCITCKKNNKGDNWRDCRLKCHYKYEQQKKDEIYKLQEENTRLKKKDDFFKQAEISHQAVQDKNKIIEKLETVIQEIKQLVSTDYIKNKKQLVQNYDCLDNFMQKIEDKCNEVQQ